MKKTIIFSLICCTLFITGCGCGKKEKTIVCQMDKTIDNYDYNAEITIVYNTKTNELISIDEKEYFDSNDLDFLNTIKSYDESQYSIYNDFENTKYSISIDGNKMTRNFYVNYKNIDIEKLIALDSQQLIFVDENRKTNINNALEYYKNNGNTCE